jgi:hypothetical protein
LRLALGHWRLVLAGLGGLALGLALLSARAESRRWHGEADRFAALYRAEQDAHRRTVADYRRTAELARARDLANAATVERDQAIISKEVSHDYQARLAALRARYDALRLRRHKGASAPADPGAGRAKDLPQAAAGAGGAAPPAGAEGFSLEERLTCSTQAEQLDALIDWVERATAAGEGAPGGPADAEGRAAPD